MSTGISGLAQAGQEIDKIPVPINYDIIRLFSEGLYRSPHKAIEELVSNGYDADARRVHVLLPEQPEDEIDVSAPLWVIDDGHGMDVDGFHQLWRVAESNKADQQPTNGRAPIGQFGIGKLAAYVLAWKLTHLSRVNGNFLLTMMNFRDVTGRQTETMAPVRVSLREVDEATAKTHLAEIEHRDPAAWKLMFDEEDRTRTWTAAALTDFKDLYNQLSAGRLGWVLSTGLPLHTDFSISLNGDWVSSSKERLQEIKTISLGSQDDSVATDMGFKRPNGKVELPGIGDISGTASIYEKQLTTGKSEEVGRSNGFFIRVRGRVINLDDELFGIEALNHAAWSRFALEVNADWLRDHLLSSREGVRDSEAIRLFRDYLRRIFNSCRSAYEAWSRKENEELDIGRLLSDAPSAHVTAPLLHSVRNTAETGTESFYIGTLRRVPDEGHSEGLVTYESEISKNPFDKTTFEKNGPNAPALHYDPASRSLVVNSEHPFIDKLTAGDKHRNPAKLFASSEVLLEGQLQDQGIDQAMIASFLSDRDRVMRLTAGDAPPTANEVLRRLDIASQDPISLERAVGAVFQVLGFEYERKGGNEPGPDGVLYARLGRHGDTLADYKLVYDAKQTNSPKVAAEKINLASLEDFRKQEQANFGFFIATAYAAESEPDGALNRRIGSEEDSYRYLTLLKIEHLRCLVWLHFRHGVTLTELRSMFENALTVPQVNDWLKSLKDNFLEQGEVPLRVLLEGLEQEKIDPLATPNIIAVRAKQPNLQNFEPERLIARLKAVENIVGNRWIEVENSGNVLMYQTAHQILEKFERNIDDLDSATDMSETTR